jgi:hypothetical protein
MFLSAYDILRILLTHLRRMPPNALDMSTVTDDEWRIFEYELADRTMRRAGQATTGWVQVAGVQVSKLAVKDMVVPLPCSALCNVHTQITHCSLANYLSIVHQRRRLRFDGNLRALILDFGADAAACHRSAVDYALLDDYEFSVKPDERVYNFAFV